MASLLQFLSHTSIFCSAIFVPLLARDCGLSFWQLGLVCALYGALQSFSHYLFGLLSDRAGRRRPFIILGLLFCALMYFLQLLMRDFFSLLLCRGLCGLATGVFSYPLVAYVAKSEGFRQRVARLSSFGSLGWAAGCLCAGILKEYEKIFTLSGALFLLAAMLAFRLNEGEYLPIPVFAKKVFKRNLLLYSLYFLRHLGAMGVWTIFPLFLRSIGATKQMIGLLYTLNAASQFLFMNLCARISQRWGTSSLLRAGFLSSAAVFLFYSLIKSAVNIFPVQILLAFSWSTLYVGSLIYLLQRNEEKATATGFLGASISASMVLGPLLGGCALSFMGFSTLFKLASLLSLFCTLFSLRL